MPKGIAKGFVKGIDKGIAKGILASMEQFDVPVPLIVRLVGTNEEEGRALLEGTELISAVSLEQGATQAAEIGSQS